MVRRAIRVREESWSDMGNGIGYKCSKCGKRYQASWGIGMMFPEQYIKLVEKAGRGDFGKAYKDLFAKDPKMAIDAEEYVYCCSVCHAWRVEPELTLYQPKDGYESIINQDYVMRNELKMYYRTCKHFSHKCPKCKGRMHRASEDEIQMLPCPYCGGPRDMDYEELIMWD